MGIFGSDKKELLIAVFNISSSSVAGALVFNRGDKLPEILTTIRLATVSCLEENFEKFQKSLYKTMEKSIEYLAKKSRENKKKPDFAVIIFSSPYYISQTRIIRLAKEKKFLITRDFLKKIINEEGDSLKKQWQEKINMSDSTLGYVADKVGTEIIEEEIMKTAINGYPVKQPAGKSAQKAEISAYLSLGIKEIQKKIGELINRCFGEIHVRFQTFPFVAFNVLNSIMDISGGLLLVDIGGEITDYSVIRDKILEETISFPLGDNFLVRRIASAFNFSFEDSLALLRQYTRGDLHAEANEKVKKIIEASNEKWYGLFQKSFKDLAGPSLSPKKILFIGGETAAVLKEYVRINGQFYAEILLPEALKEHFTFRKGFGEDKDILLMISALFVDKLF